MSTLAPENGREKKKIGEVQRLLQVMAKHHLQADDLAEITGVSARTIKNCIWNNSEIGGQLLRGLHLKLGVSVDWVLSGNGSMLPGIGEPAALYDADSRGGRMIRFIKKWMRDSSEDEKVWLEQQFKFAVPQYRQFIEEAGEA
jgi:hypothetical protein